ncbi:aldo/keto reductase [Natronomonas sp. CBA1123]|uniref:aldo/keto reductase n=1 Tax=Natronomonas sp. CBA1123 TaxID=2668070 RepID=UPI0012EAFDF7|nr:aldo/keto reductase [Natronomonas sp. CBA1123]MUV87679.1 aldo/keto reductase [Natronomonas sp. CBA1123]
MAVEDLPALGIGTYENTDYEVCANSVETALNAGYRHVDTAEGYDNEAAVGDGIVTSGVDREDVFLATKVSPDNLAYDDVLDHARASIDRLGVETLDLLYVHWPIRAYDREGTLAAFDELYDDGLIRNVGLSNFTPELLEDAIETLDAPLFAHQVECHPLFQQDELRAMAREHGHHLVAYTPLAKGDVTDVPELVDIAEKHDATPAQVALSWLLSKESVSAIPKSATPEHIRENFGALEVTLDDEDVSRIDDIDREKRYVDFEEAPWN